MKTLIATSFTALLLAGAVVANAASPVTPATPGTTTSAAVSTPYAQSGRGSEAVPIFNYQGAAPLASSIARGRSDRFAPWNVDLAHQTGGNM
ncbi:MAG: hypothetical protein ACREFO_17260 [Acetobacteraceae bacterium]